MSQQHQLAAILFTDIVGHTLLMQENERMAVASIKHYNAALERTMAKRDGKILNYMVMEVCVVSQAPKDHQSSIQKKKLKI